jgi:hypothetical protein
MSEDGFADDPDEPTWRRAQLALSSYPGIPEPAISPTLNGGVFVEWHEHGLDVELRFRAGGRLWLGVSDRLVEVPPVAAAVADPEAARPALLALIARNAPGQ